MRGLRRFNPQLKAVYLRLTNAGKAKKVALIALARKILILANALIQENRPWQPRCA
jgi:transposase